MAACRSTPRDVKNLTGAKCYHPGGQHTSYTWLPPTLYRPFNVHGYPFSNYKIIARMLTTVILAAACGFSWVSADTKPSGADSQALAIPPKTCPLKLDVLSRGYPSCPPILDEKSPPVTWSPWTHRPYCVIVPTKKEGEEEEEDEDEDEDEENDESDQPGNITLEEGTKYCVYTSDIIGPYGVSIVSREQPVTDAATLLWQAYDSTFPSPETVQRLNLEPAYEVVDMPDKGGAGVVATRLIKAGETFMVDYASMLAELDLWSIFDKPRVVKLLRKAVQQLVDPDAAVLDLTASGAPGHVDPAAGVLWSNTFRTELLGTSFTGLYPKISVSCASRARRTLYVYLADQDFQRMNHACNSKLVTSSVSAEICT
jgi:hypothetical protein